MRSSSDMALTMVSQARMPFSAPHNCFSDSLAMPAQEHTLIIMSYSPQIQVQASRSC